MSDIFEVRGEPNYAAEVRQIGRLESREGLDNLMAVPWAGLQALVGKDHAPEDIMVFFPAEAQLSDKFLRENNLYRDTTLNEDPTQKGYMEKNGRVRAIRLRGVTSSALALPLSSLLRYTDTPPPVGTRFDTINGEEICRKYEKPVKAPTGAAATLPKWRRVDDTMLPQHFDTLNYWRERDRIGPDEHVVVTQKLHGCFAPHTKVLMWDGTVKRIVNIKEGDVVVGVRDGVPAPSRVLSNAFQTKTVEKWTKLKFTQPLQGDRPTTFSTPDHRFLTTGGYKRADRLVPGDRVYYTRHQPLLTPVKESVLTGMLLGDGSVAGTRRNEVQWSHKEAHTEYVRYKQSLLGNLSGTGRLARRVSGYGTRMVGTRTRQSESIRRFVARWEGGVPSGLELDALSLAIWYMDDGSLAHSELQQDRALFAVCGMNEREVVECRSAMLRFGFDNPVMYRDPAGYWRMRLNKDDAEQLFLAIRTFVPPVMQYKLPEYHRGFFEERGVQDHTGPLLFNSVVDEVSEVSAQSIQYSGAWDISTETENFVANRIVVHNSSVRIGRVPVRVKPSWKHRLARWFGIPVREYDVDVVGGSRRVIKDPNDPDQNHFYDRDIWSAAALKYGEAVPENVILYGELVGYVNSKPIQTGYTYNLLPGKYDLYVYRVSVVTPNGGLYDLSWAGVKEFCQERGLKHVPELWAGEHRNFDADKWVDARYHDDGFSNAVQLSRANTVDEGVCVRAEGVIPTILKAKSPQFFEFETKLLDEGVEILS